MDPRGCSWEEGGGRAIIQLRIEANPSIKKGVKGCYQLGDPGSIKTSASQKLSQGGEVWQGLQAGKRGSTHLAKASFISFPPLAKV